MNKLRDLVPWRGNQEKSVPVRRETDPVTSLHREVNRVFDSFFSCLGIEPFRQISEQFAAFSPRIDVDERDNEVRITAEVPGMDAQDIQLTLRDDALVLSGEKRHEEERNEGSGTYYRESSYGAFERVIPLGGIEVDTDKVKATLKKGRLSVVLPKTEITRRSE